MNPSSTTRKGIQKIQNSEREDPIFEARHIEWPLPSVLPAFPEEQLTTAPTDKSGVLGGFVGKFMTGQNQTEKDTFDPKLAGNRPLKAPRLHCTAAANGLIVSVIECGSVSSSNHLRLLSRWNVRRNTHEWLLVPNTVHGPSNSTSSTSTAKKGRIAHVFLDPTGSHALLSGANGDLYYSHTSGKSVRKLKGFGLNTDGSGSFRPGKAWREVTSLKTGSSQKESAVQLGLTPGCYITSVAWHPNGTERASSTILLGSSFGEIYQYEIEADDDEGSTSGNSEEKLPSLMVRLNESESGTGTGTSSGIVSGLHFSLGEDENSGSVVLAATSGVNKQTRLHSYLSTGKSDRYDGNSSKLQNVFSSGDNKSTRSFFELPGSINYAHLHVYDTCFALRTETGIYHGTIDQSNGRNVPWNKRGNGIVDAGMFMYEGSSLPISIAITPYHFITLCDSNEVRFINRVAKKTIQKERLDWVAMAQASGSNIHSDSGILSGQSELIMDVRRPDQVWLRKSRSLIHISSTREDRDVWKFSLDACLKGTSSGAFTTPHASMRRLNDDKFMDSEFEHTKSLCSNGIQKAVVNAARAEFHLSHGRIELAAKYMAQCPPTLKPFAETAIRLALPAIGIKDKKAIGESNLAKEALKGGNAGLIAYLSDKMRSAKARNDEVAW